MSNPFGLPEPHFVDRDPQAVTAEMIRDYEAMAERPLQPAQVERLLIDHLAYRETLLRIGIQEAAKQNLLAYAAGAQLDHLGLLVDTVRLPARRARTLLRFTLGAPAGADTAIPAGTRVRPARGQVLFATTTAAVIAAGQTAVAVAAEAVAPGPDGNGFLAGQIDSLVAPLPGVTGGVTVANVTATAGGAAVEDDERLRLRIRAAPRAFSTAGPEGAYAWWAMSAHQDIVDVAVLSPVPAEVEIYPLGGFHFARSRSPTTSTATRRDRPGN